jgi:hypothetical protein
MSYSANRAGCVGSVDPGASGPAVKVTPEGESQSLKNLLLSQVSQGYFWLNLQQAESEECGLRVG